MYILKSVTAKIHELTLGLYEAICTGLKYFSKNRKNLLFKLKDSKLAAVRTDTRFVSYEIQIIKRIFFGFFTSVNFYYGMWF